MFRKTRLNNISDNIKIIRSAKYCAFKCYRNPKLVEQGKIWMKNKLNNWMTKKDTLKGFNICKMMQKYPLICLADAGQLCV